MAGWALIDERASPFPTGCTLFGYRALNEHEVCQGEKGSGRSGRTMSQDIGVVLVFRGLEAGR